MTVRVIARRVVGGVETDSFVGATIDADTGAVIAFVDWPARTTGAATPRVSAADAQEAAKKAEVPLMVGLDGYSGWAGLDRVATLPTLRFGYSMGAATKAGPQQLIWSMVVCPAKWAARLETDAPPERMLVEVDAHTGRVLSRMFLGAETARPKREPASDLDWARVAAQAKQGRPFSDMLGVDPIKKCIARSLAPDWRPPADARWRRDAENRSTAYLAWTLAEVRALMVVTAEEEGFGAISLRLEGPPTDGRESWLPAPPVADPRAWLQPMALKVVNMDIVRKLSQPDATRRFHLQATERLLDGSAVPTIGLMELGRRVSLFGRAREQAVVVRVEIQEEVREPQLIELIRQARPK